VVYQLPVSRGTATEFQCGEVVEWIIEDKGQPALRRRAVPPSAMKNAEGSKYSDGRRTFWFHP